MITRDLNNVIYMTELDDITMEIALAFYKGDNFIKDNIKIICRPIFCDFYKVAEAWYKLDYTGFYDVIKSVKNMRKNRVPFTEYKMIISDNTNNLISHYLSDYHLDNAGNYNFHKLHLNVNDNPYSMWCTNKMWKSAININDSNVKVEVANDEDSIQRLSHAIDEAENAINKYIDRTKKELGIDEFQSELLRYEFLNLE